MQPIIPADAESRIHAPTKHATSPSTAPHPVISCALATAIAAETDDERVAIGITGHPTGRFRLP